MKTRSEDLLRRLLRARKRPGRARTSPGQHENDSNDSTIAVLVSKEWQPMCNNNFDDGVVVWGVAGAVRRVHCHEP
jgi:hypothetical protein